ncbi:4'-phosphopantetheinyl transferase [Streptomyces sp. NPDC053367]|uniref:4'-phosphopantetheinyl transferase n=1 Tax=Streptomyces sp. NPDC053367 TaxID=3365700 RepID=UPI0037D3A74A
MIEEMFPAPVVAVDTRDDAPQHVLYPEERALLLRAVPVRRREFTTVRSCARTALSRLGVPPAPLLPGSRGAPVWPDGVVGSMTHCSGYRASAVARSRDVLTIGLDAEPNGPLPPGLLATIAHAEERRWIAELSERHTEVHWDRLLFSAKEAVYKAWYPLTERWLDFKDAVLTPDVAHGTFHARLLVPGARVGGRRLSEFTGRWLVRDGLVLTAIAQTA